MAASPLRDTHSAPDSNRTIIFNGEIHPYHILRPKIQGNICHFAWYLHDCEQNGLLYVDFVACEQMINGRTVMNTWQYYSIAFGLLKQGWEIISPNDEALISRIIPMTAENAAQLVQTLLTKLEKINIADLNLTPEIPDFFRSPVETDEIVDLSRDNKFIAKFRIEPTEKQANKNSIYQNCNSFNLDKEALQKAISTKSSMPIEPKEPRNLIALIFGKPAAN